MTTHIVAETPDIVREARIAHGPCESESQTCQSGCDVRCENKGFSPADAIGPDTHWDA